MDWLAIDLGLPREVPSHFPNTLSVLIGNIVEEDFSIKVFSSRSGDYYVYRNDVLVSKVSCSGVLISLFGNQVRRKVDKVTHRYIYDTINGSLHESERGEFFINEKLIARVYRGETLSDWLARLGKDKKLALPKVIVGIFFDGKQISSSLAVTLFVMNSANLLI